ncbi:MAG: NAD-binding protein, partial [Planctomycetota bacterium]
MTDFPDPLAPQPAEPIAASTEVCATLDPPGSIVVVGAGILGIEAALYGRYLGYQVTLLESGKPVKWMNTQRDEPIPMLPGRCVSPLALAAIAAQQASSGGVGNAWEQPKSMPLTIGQWQDNIWRPLLETDLLRGRLECDTELQEIQWAPEQMIESAGNQEDAEEADDDIPP